MVDIASFKISIQFLKCCCIMSLKMIIFVYAKEAPSSCVTGFSPFLNAPLAPSAPCNLSKWAPTWLPPCALQLDHWSQQLVFLLIRGGGLFCPHIFVVTDSSVLEELQTTLGVSLDI